MFKDHNIFIFNYDFNRAKLLNEFKKNHDKFESYNDPRGSLDNFQVARHIKFDYADELCHTFNVNGKPRFYIVKANSELPQHSDHGTLCSINVLLTDNPAAIQFGNNEYFYMQSLLNTQNMHGVINGNEDRLLFKLSIFDEPFEAVADKIKKVVC